MMGFEAAGAADGFGSAGAFATRDDFADEAFGAGAFGASAASGFGGDAFGLGGGGSPDDGRSLGRGGGSDGLFGPLSDEEAGRLARAFEQARSPDGFVQPEDGRMQLQRTGLGDQLLQSVWNLSDLDRDGRLSLREFACALHLAEQARSGRELPVEVRPEQQERLARAVERQLTAGSSAAAFPDALDAAKPSRHPDYSTADTAATDVLGGLPGPAESDFGTMGSRLGVRANMGFDSAAGSLGAQAAGRNLGQLAAVLEAVARLDAGGELRRLSREVLEERRQLEAQLSRRREFESQLRESRGQLDGLREERRRVENSSASAQRRISHLQEELGVVEREVRAAEEDLQLLRESSGLGSERRQGPTPYGSAEEERRDVISKVRAERELLQRDQKSIEELRARLDAIFKQKLDAQMIQQSLLEKQRQTEQDRGLMLTAIEAERGKLSAMRAERIKLWEERSALEREMGELTQERWLVEHLTDGARGAGGGGQPPATAAGPGPATAAQRMRGVREGEMPPAVVFGGPEEAFASSGGFGGRRPAAGGGGYPGGEAAVGRAEAPTRDFALGHLDSRGVRNGPADVAGAGGWSTFGDGGGPPSGVPGRSRYGAFGTN